MAYLMWKKKIRIALAGAVLASVSAANGANVPPRTMQENSDIVDLVSKNRHQELIVYLERRFGQNEPDAGELHDLCSALRYAGQFGKMQKCFEKLQHKSPDGTVRARVAGNPAMTIDMTDSAYGMMAGGYLEIGQYDKAIAAGRRAMASISNPDSYPAKLSMPLILTNIGSAYALQGDIAKAHAVIEELRRIKPETAGLGATTAQLVGTQIEFAKFRIYMNTSEFDLALPAFERSYMANPPEVVDWYRQAGKMADLAEMEALSRASRAAIRANILVELKRYGEAMPLYEEALAYPRFKDMATLLWTTYFNRGRAAARMGQDELAIASYILAVDQIEAMRASLSDENSKIGFVGNKQEVYEHLIRALLKAKRNDQAFSYVERAKARAFVDMLAGRLSKPRTSSQAAALIDQMTQIQGELSADASDLQQPGSKRALLTSTAEKFRQEAPELASLVTVSGIELTRLQSLLPKNETLVEYYGKDDALVAFVITAGSFRTVSLNGQGLGSAVRAFRASVQNPASRDSQPLAASLHARLIAPLGLPAKGQLAIVPHGVLHYVPFSALSSGKSSLLEDYSIRILPSASVLNYIGQKKSAGQGLLILGNPDLNNPQYDLPGAQKEALEIARLRPDATLLMRKAASKSAVVNSGGKYAYLHFASHGQFNAEQPLQSGLFLAPDAAGADGKLTVDDLYGLSLDVDLATLSACETALGRVDNGDDVVGLSRGFFYAGASSVISSLWSVDDEATYQIMTQFYKELPTASKADALLKAQRAVKARYPHPFYWAAFQIAGNR